MYEEFVIRNADNSMVKQKLTTQQIEPKIIILGRASIDSSTRDTRSATWFSNSGISHNR